MGTRAVGKITKGEYAEMAIVGNKRWEHLLAKIVHPFFAVECRFFNVEDIDAAWMWLRE